MKYLLRQLRLFYRRNYAALWVLPMVAVIVFYTVNIEPRQLAVTEYDVKLPPGAEALTGFKIALMADLHADQLQISRLKEIVNQINSLDPDLILLGGDLINGRGSSLPVERLINDLSQLRAPHGVFAILGNHEVRRGHPDNFARAMARANIRLLRDECVQIPDDQAKLNLIGLDYLTTNFPTITERTKPLLRKNLLNIVLAHVPETFDKLPDSVFLTLAGHTHGGQVTIPILKMPLIQRERGKGNEYNYGLIRRKQRTLIVTSGIGSAYAQARLAMKPEIVLVNLIR